MTLEQQVVSLDLAKRMKELGFKQESLFYHVFRRNQNVEAKAWFIYSGDHINEGTVWDSKTSKFAPIKPLIEKKIAAYTVAELGKMMPEKVCWRGYSNNGVKWQFEFGDFTVSAESEADARAKMLIYLAENKLINPSRGV